MVTENYSFYFYIDFAFALDSTILNNQENSKFILINPYMHDNLIIFYIINFENTLIINQITDQNCNNCSYIKKISHKLKINENQIDMHPISKELKDYNDKDIILEEVINFIDELNIKTNGQSHLNLLWKIIRPSIVIFLLKQSHQKSIYKQNLFDDQIIKPIENYDEYKYIELRYLGHGSSSKVKLIYLIEEKELYALKSFYNEETKNREIDNYKKINYPLLPKLYALTKDRNLIIQFINGKTLMHINKNIFNLEQIMNIILQLAVIIKYFHENKLIYRDLKPDNIIIDDNCNVFIVDFDRMIDVRNNEMHTADFSSIFIAPEAINGEISYENDIYSLGKIIIYILNENKEQIKLVKEDEVILEAICKKCVDKCPYNRMSIYIVILLFYISIEITTSKIVQNDSYIEFINAIVKNKKEINREEIRELIQYYSLAVNQNDPDAQFIIGAIYYEGKYVPRNINKTIHYFTQAAKLNHKEAQFFLGAICYNGKHIPRNINKSIYYFTLASNNNHPDAQFNLGIIFYEDQYIPRNINKSIYYLTLASNQNHSDAQFVLGAIYYKGQYVKRNMNKSIQYLTLASSQNNPDAQFILGAIYYEDEYVKRNMNKSIHYLTMAANHNHSEALFNLGMIYTTGLFVDKKMIKGIDYFIQSSSNGHIDGHFAVGYFYQEGKYVERDMKKSIYHYKEASSFNHQYAKNNLGIIYKNGISNIIQPNIGYAIEYFKEAISQKNDLLSKYNLSHIYIYEYSTKENIDESIKILIKSIEEVEFSPSYDLLFIALIKKHGFNIEQIKKELYNNTHKNSELVDKIVLLLNNKNLMNEKIFENQYQFYKTIDFLYDFKRYSILSKKIYECEIKTEPQKNKIINFVTSDFYEGFGNDL